MPEFVCKHQNNQQKFHNSLLSTPLPAKIYANEGLCQIIFFQSDEVCEVSYRDRKGKYQSQQGIVLPKVG